MGFSPVAFSSLLLGGFNSQRNIVNGYVLNLGGGSFISVKHSEIGYPILNIEEKSNLEIEARVTIPTVTIYNNPISNLTELSVLLLEETIFLQNPFDGINVENLISYAENNSGQSSIVFLTDDDIGALKLTRFSGLEKKTYWISCFITTE